MASYRNKLPAASGGSQPSFQRGVYVWSAGTTVVIPISVVPASNSFITQMRASFVSGYFTNATTFTAAMKSTGDGIELFRSDSTANISISWEVCTDPSASVQRGVQSFTTQQESNITIPAIMNLSKASARVVGLAQSFAKSTNIQIEQLAVRCELSTANIKLRRDAANAPAQVSWEIVTYV